MKIKEVMEDFKKRKKKEKMIIAKIYLVISLELLRAVRGQFSFR